MTVAVPLHLSRIVEAYLLASDNVTEDEKRDLQEWVAAGNSVYDNPYLLYNESGCPMDFINGCRLGAEMTEDPSSFFGTVPDDIGSDNWDDDIPF